MAYPEQPYNAGTKVKVVDGNLLTTSSNPNPAILVLGTAGKGDSETLYQVERLASAKSTFGIDGTLYRGMAEVHGGGGDDTNILGYRIGASPATLSGVGTAATITTVMADNDIGSEYAITYNTADSRLRVWRVEDEELIYDNWPAMPVSGVDLGEVIVTGTPAAGVSIGTTDFDAFTDAVVMGNITVGGTYTRGSDGIDISRMKLYEALEKAYRDLENADIDIVVPMNAYLDDLNVMDMTTTEVTTFNTAAPWAGGLNTYPTAGTTYDGLGKVFIQEYQGQVYFWWDLDNDGAAELWPVSVGSSSATLDANGVTLTAADFHEANFAYQLANFCYVSTENNVMMNGAIGVNPPDSFSPKAISDWVGELPVYTTDANDNQIVSTNGRGLLGNKFMAGRKAGSGTTAGLPGWSVNGVDGLADGGFIATDDGYIDGTQVEDENEHLVDIGKYLSIVCAYPILSNNSRTSRYIASGAADYAGFYSMLAAKSAPTNKVIPVSGLPFRLNNTKLNDLASLRYVMFREKTKGFVVADAPTAARPDSDYQRLTTFRIIKDLIDEVRDTSDPFIGEGGGAISRAALQTNLERMINEKFVKDHSVTRFEVSVTATPIQQVQGDADVWLKVVPVFELREITVHVSLAAE